MKRFTQILTLLTCLIATNALAYKNQADCESYEGAGGCCGAADGSWHRCAALPSALNYSGTLASNNVALNGSYDFVFQLFDGPVGATNITMTTTNFSVPVTNGQFTTVILGFYPDDFAGPNPYLQVALRRGGSGAPFVTLSPRQRLAEIPRA